MNMQITEITIHPTNEDLALDFVIKKVFRVSVVERDEQKSSAKIFRCVNERTFFWQKHTRLLRPNDFLEP
jgi:hypothetical protein